MEHLQRSGLFDASPQRRARDRFMAQADKVLSSARRAPSRGAKGKFKAVEPSNDRTEMQVVSPPAARAGAAQYQFEAVATMRAEEHRRTVSMSSTASSATVDEAIFDTLVAAFPQPPVEDPPAGQVPSPTYVATRKGSLRPTPPPPAGPPPTAPLPAPPIASSSKSIELTNDASARARRPPPFPLPPLPSSVSHSLAQPSLRSLVLQPTPPPPTSPTTATSSPFSFSPYNASAVPSPSSPDFPVYQLPRTRPRTSYEMRQQKPLPPLPPPTQLHPQPHPLPTPSTAIPDALARFAFPPSPPRAPPSAPTSAADDSPVQMHISLPQAPPLTPRSPSRARRRARTRTESTASSTSFASGTSRSSLQIENITADLSLLVESFRPGAGAALAVAEHTPRPAHVDEEDEREKEEQRLLLRRVRSTVELQQRKMSVASSVGSGSAVSEAGSTMTRGGYRAYKLTRRSSFLPSPNPQRGRTASTSSRRSSGSSVASSEEEELFDLSFDTPNSSPITEREGFSWTSPSLGGFRYGRRKSSATTVDSASGMMERSKSDQGPSIERTGADEREEILSATAMRRNASTDALRLAHHHRPSPPLSPHPSLLPLAPRGIPASRTERTLTSTRSTPTLRRPPLPLPTSSLSIPPVSAPMMARKRSFGSAPPPLPTVAEPDSEADHAPPRSPALAPAGAGSRLRPLVTAASSSSSAARASSSAQSTQAQGSRLPPPRQKPLALAPSSASSTSALAPIVPALRTRKSGLPSASSAPALLSPTVAAGARKSSLPCSPSLPLAVGARTPQRPSPALVHGHGRRQSLLTLPYVGCGGGGAAGEREVPSGERAAVKLPKR
ncbi:hypothetical protein JCM10450v2_006246 [Rhodotorula kratochvilovae]